MYLSAYLYVNTLWFGTVSFDSFSRFILCLYCFVYYVYDNPTYEVANTFICILLYYYSSCPPPTSSPSYYFTTMMSCWGSLSSYSIFPYLHLVVTLLQNTLGRFMPDIIHSRYSLCPVASHFRLNRLLPLLSFLHHQKGPTSVTHGLSAVTSYGFTYRYYNSP